MQVTQIKNGKIMIEDIPKPTDQELKNEYDYLLAEQITRNLLHNNLISPEEFDKIMAKNLRTFSPYLSKIFC